MIKNNFKLDLKDKKILYELDLNSRQPCSKIAKKVGLSVEVVNYRIKKLEEEKIITHYQVIVNLAKLGILQFKICLSFQHLNSEKLDLIIEKLKKNKSIKWIVSCQGNWDLIISLETYSITKIELLKNEVISLFGTYINKKTISILSEGVAYNRDYLLEEKFLKNQEIIIMKECSKVKLDQLDFDILKHLSENARKSIVDIATELKINVRIINYRIQQMIKDKIILGFKIALNYEKIGIKFYKSFIYLDTPQEEKIKELLKYFRNHKNIIHNGRVLGNWDLEPEFEVYSEKEFYKILEKIKDQFSDIIKSVDIITIFKEYKFVYL